MPPRVLEEVQTPQLVRASHADLAEIVALDRLAMGTHYQIEPEKAEFVLDHGAIFGLRSPTGQLIGEVQVVFEQCPNVKHALLSDQAYCASLAIHPDWQGRRLARTLLAAQNTWARESGCRQICLSCRVENFLGLALWFKEGYRIIGYDPTYYGQRADDGARLLLRKDLDSQSERIHRGRSDMTHRVVMVNFASHRIDFRAHEHIARLLEEGYIGYQVSQSAGIFFSH